MPSISGTTVVKGVAIFVIDDGPADRTSDAIASEFPWVTVVKGIVHFAGPAP